MPPNVPSNREGNSMVAKPIVDARTGKPVTRETIDAQFEPEPFVYVEAASPEAARKFFGAPVDWPVEFHKEGNSDNRSVYRLPSKGLIIR